LSAGALNETGIIPAQAQAREAELARKQEAELAVMLEQLRAKITLNRPSRQQ